MKDLAGLMARKSPKLDVVRALFARSGNQCAFPKCQHSLVNKKNQYVGEICHIEAASPGGQRYNSQQTDEQRRDYENLVVMCHAHHVETNEASEYTVEVMKAFKQDHERRYEESSFQVDESVLQGIADDIQIYWDRIDRLNRFEHVAPPDVAVSIDSKATFMDIIESCRDSLEWLCARHDSLRESNERLPGDFCRLLQDNGVDPTKFDDVPIPENPFVSRDWETYFIALPNGLQRLQVDLVHLELKFLEECLKTDAESQEVKSRLDETRRRFAQMAQSEVAVD